jgi:hypothetical protein
LTHFFQVLLFKFSKTRSQFYRKEFTLPLHHMEQKTIHRKFYKKKNPKNRGYRKSNQYKKKFINLGPLSEDEKKIIRYIKDKLRERKLKSYGHGFVGVHCRNYVAKEIPYMTGSHARVLLKRLAKRRIIELRNAQKNSGYEFAVKFVNRDSRQNRYKELYRKDFSGK